jgi:hypothetical protein
VVVAPGTVVVEVVVDGGDVMFGMLPLGPTPLVPVPGGVVEADCMNRYSLCRFVT